MTERKSVKASGSGCLQGLLENNVSCYRQTVAVAMYKLILLETAYVRAMQVQGRQNSNMKRGGEQKILLPHSSFWQMLAPGKGTVCGF